MTQTTQNNVTGPQNNDSLQQFHIWQGLMVHTVELA